MLKPSHLPIATYRVQFNKSFSFSQAAEILDYLHDLGITDLYASPIFQAGPESTHGYDICDFNVVNPALGGEKDFKVLAGALRQRKMGLLVDMVPNHMGNDQTNCWWRDVLRNGRQSQFANFFDINWDSPEPGLKGKVLLPVLGDHYHQVLEKGELKLAYKEGEFKLTYYAADFPLSEESIRKLEEEKIDAAALHEINGIPGKNGTFDRLHTLIEMQHYRLAFWRIGPEEINYRRFFDITGLVSLKMERQEVFDKTHEAVMRFMASGEVTGLRIDHPDGLWDPKGYFQKIQTSFSQHAPNKGDAYVVVEKILSEDETLPLDWPVHGTTGYDYLNQLNGIFVKPDSCNAFHHFYQEFTGNKVSMYDLLGSAKRQLLHSSFISEKRSLTRSLKLIAAATRFGRDLTQSRLEEALEELLAHFPIYRTYVDENSTGLTENETRYLTHAYTKAEEIVDAQSKAALQFLRKILTLDYPADLSAEAKEDVRTFIRKFQQLSGPLMAKGLEDTTFYRYFPFVSLNEVGGNPSEWGKSIEQFHAFNLLRNKEWPHSLSATATHDTKRGEDTRARMNVLSEMPEQWVQMVQQWCKLNHPHKRNGFPSPNDEYLLYQMLIGVWPFETNPAELESLKQRVQVYMLKAIREGKLYTSWIDNNPQYEEAVSLFIEKILLPGTDFVSSMAKFQQKVAYFGLFNSLSQTLLKITSPGVPDFYQGSELWDFNMVDPDNRRPVDYQFRKVGLKQLVSSPPTFGKELFKDWQKGLIKLYTITRALEFRKKRAQLFQEGSYLPCLVQGEKADHLCAFIRSSNNGSVIVAAPRFVYTLMQGEEQLPPGNVWGDTWIPTPKETAGKYRNVFTGESIVPQHERINASELFATFPLAILEPA